MSIAREDASRCYSPREWLNFLLLSSLAIFSVFILSTIPKYSPENALNDWIEYAAVPYETTGENSTEFETIHIEKEAISVDISEIFPDLPELPDFQIATMQQVSFHQNGTSNLSAHFTYEFDSPREVNKYLPSFFFFSPLIAAYQNFSTFDLNQVVIGLPFEYVPTNWTGFWDHITIVNYWGGENNLVGYHYTNTESANNTDFEYVSVPGVGSVKTYNLNFSGTIVPYDVPGYTPGYEYYRCDKIDLKSLRSVSTKTYFGTSLDLFSLERSIMTSLAGGMTAEPTIDFMEDKFNRLDQVPGFFDHVKMTATKCGFYIFVDSEFNLTQHFEETRATTPIDLVKWNTNNLSDYTVYPPEDAFFFYEINPFLGVIYNFDQVMNRIFGNLLGVWTVGIATIIFINVFSFPGEKEFREENKILCEVPERPELFNPPKQRRMRI